MQAAHLVATESEMALTRARYESMSPRLRALQAHTQQEAEVSSSSDCWPASGAGLRSGRRIRTSARLVQRNKNITPRVHTPRVVL